MKPMDALDNFVLGPLDWIDLVWSYIGPVLKGYAPWHLYRINVWVDGKGPLGKKAPYGSACPKEVRDHLAKYGVRVWCRGFNATTITYVVPKSQANWAGHLVKFDRHGYASLEYPDHAWNDGRGGILGRITRFIKSGFR